MSLHVIEVGIGNTQTVVFLHGAALGGWMWRAQYEALVDTFHCLAPDLPEHGKSEGRYSLEKAVAAVADLIREKAHGGKAFLVGLSLGGLIAIELIHKYPELIEKAIVSAPPSGPMPGTSAILFATRFMLPLMKSDLVIRRTARSLHLTAADYEQFRQAQKSMSRDLVSTVTRELHAHRLPQSLRDATIPTLAVVGEKELGVNFRVVRNLVALMPTAQGRIAPDVGHGWSGENPDLFNRMIRDWFLEGTIPDELMALKI